MFSNHPAMADTNVSTLFSSLKFSVPVHIPFVNLRSRRRPNSRINPAVYTCFNAKAAVVVQLLALVGGQDTYSWETGRS